MASLIEWTDDTWNFVNGCTRVSAGCDHCYIERTVPMRRAHARFDKPGVGGTTGVTLFPQRLTLPLRWRKPRRVFVNSMGDTFHDDIPTDMIASAFATMVAAPRHTFQVLTKRPGRMRSLLRSGTFWTAVSEHLGRLWGTPAPAALTACPPWIWLGVSVEDQAAANLRIPLLLEIPAAVRWLSCEPLLGPVDISRWLYLVGASTGGPWTDGLGRQRFTDGRGQRLPSGAGGMTISHIPAGDLHWVVAGGETGGPANRATRPEWLRSLRDQCVDADVDLFFKQWGDWAWPEQMPADTYQQLDAAINLAQPHPGPFRVGKKAAGRKLDEVEWNQYPQVA